MLGMEYTRRPSDIYFEKEVSILDKDVVSKARKFLGAQVDIVEKLDDNEMDALEKWLEKTIYLERNGWREKLKAALNEAEKYRKQLLDSEAGNTARSNDHKAPDEDELPATSFPSTSKEGDIYDSLRRRVEHLEKFNRRIVADRRMCVSLLKIEKAEYDVDISTYLRQYLNHMEQIHRQYAEMEWRSAKLFKKLKAELAMNIEWKEKLQDENRKLNKAIKHQTLQRSVDPMATVPVQNALVKLHTTQDSLHESLENLRNDLAAKVDKIEHLQNDIQQLKQEKSTLDDNLSERQRQLDKYEKLIISLKHASTYTRPVAKQQLPRDENDVRRAFIKCHYGLVTNAKPAAAKFYRLAGHLSHRPEVTAPSDQFPPAKTAVTRCARCNKLYRLMDNNKFACKYHPKPKHRQEVFDSRGRLLTVHYVWECCHGSGDADGCATKIHI